MLPRRRHPQPAATRSHTLNLGPDGGYRGAVSRLSWTLDTSHVCFPILFVLPPLLPMSFSGAKTTISSGTAPIMKKSFSNRVRFKRGQYRTLARLVQPAGFLGVFFNFFSRFSSTQRHTIETSHPAAGGLAGSQTSCGHHRHRHDVWFPCWMGDVCAQRGKGTEPKENNLKNDGGRKNHLAADRGATPHPASCL